MQEVIVEKSKISVSGLPSGCELMWVLYRETYSGKVVAVPFGEALGGTDGKRKVPRSKKYQKAVETGLLARAVKMRMETNKSMREIHIEFGFQLKIGWSEVQMAKYIKDEIDAIKLGMPK